MEIDELVRSNRKTIALIVTSDARLVVRVPRFLPLKRIEELVENKTAWIEKQKAKMRQKLQVISGEPIGINEGQLIPLLGQFYPLGWSEHQGNLPEIHDGKFIIKWSEQTQLKKNIINWYKKEARHILSERVELLSRQIGIDSFNTIRITSARTRWGSCSAKGNLSFTWRLVATPLYVVDYVVIHELVHLKIRNHSKNFWTQVKLHYPDYKIAITWLKHIPFFLPF